jgi:phosphohistidine swiveling domain-containing protein
LLDLLRNESSTFKMKALSNQSSSLQQRFPTVYQQLLQVRKIAEKHYRDVCDIEFIVENGRLFVTQVRPAKQASVAHIHSTLAFLDEGLITPKEALCRITSVNVADLLRSKILNRSRLPLVGTGLPAFAGGATGQVAFTAGDLLRLTQAGTPSILVREEISPQDLRGIEAAQAVLTMRGGVTSHAALACRALQKPCVVGYSPSNRPREIGDRAEEHFSEGSWITLDGSTGEVFLGKGKCQSVPWRENPDSRYVAELITHAIKTANVPIESVGEVWRIHDFLFESVPLLHGITKKQATARRTFVSFEMPKERVLRSIRFHLVSLPLDVKANYGLVLVSLMEWLLRSLGAEVGVGNHYRYFRPLWDPMQALYNDDERSSQLVGMEFFSVNRFLSKLIDVSSITIVLEIDVRTPQTTWFLDFTNRMGESLMARSDSVLAYRLGLNGLDVPHPDVPVLYNSIRRRAYGWPRYDICGASHADVIDTLARWSDDERSQSPFLPLCLELGLIHNRKLTNVGRSLLGKSSSRNANEFLYSAPTL